MAISAIRSEEDAESEGDGASGGACGRGTETERWGAVRGTQTGESRATDEQG